MKVLAFLVATCCPVVRALPAPLSNSKSEGVLAVDELFVDDLSFDGISLIGLQRTVAVKKQPFGKVESFDDSIDLSFDGMSLIGLQRSVAVKKQSFAKVETFDDSIDSMDAAVLGFQRSAEYHGIAEMMLEEEDDSDVGFASTLALQRTVVVNKPREVDVADSHVADEDDGEAIADFGGASLLGLQRSISMRRTPRNLPQQASARVSSSHPRKATAHRGRFQSSAGDCQCLEVARLTSPSSSSRKVHSSMTVHSVRISSRS